jgi:hypothetical protein
MAERVKFEVPEPPRPVNYKAEVSVTVTGSFECGVPMCRGTLTCTECDEKLADIYDADDLDNTSRITRHTDQHNRRKHPGLLCVYTSAGWMKVKDLVPDPVETLNKAIDKDVATRVFRCEA